MSNATNQQLRMTIEKLFEIANRDPIQLEVMYAVRDLIECIEDKTLLDRHLSVHELLNVALKYDDIRQYLYANNRSLVNDLSTKRKADESVPPGRCSVFAQPITPNTSTELQSYIETSPTSVGRG